jgi:hypothetical protein
MRERVVANSSFNCIELYTILLTTIWTESISDDKSLIINVINHIIDHQCTSSEVVRILNWMT